MPTESTSAEPSDEALMRRVRDGDDRALGLVYDRYASLVLAVARSVTGADSDAEEVAEDVFIHVWERADQYDRARGSLRAYLVTVARSRARDRIRARKRRSGAVQRSADADAEDVAVPLSRPGEDPDRRLRRVEARARLDGLFRVLSDVQREAIELAYFEGLTQSEIAERIDAPLGTVKTRIRDGMAKLREAVGTPEGAS